MQKILSYFSVAVIALIVAILVLTQVLWEQKSGTKKRSFILMVISMFGYCFLDCMISYIDSDGVTFNFYVAYIINGLFNNCMMLFSFSFLRHVRANFVDKNKGLKIVDFIFYGLTILMNIAYFVFIKTDYFLVSDENMKFDGFGMLDSLWNFIGYVYVAITMVFVIVLTSRKKEYSFRGYNAQALMCFCVNLFFILLQLLDYSIPAGSCGSILTVVFMYAALLRNSITVDSITKLDNKQKLLADMAKKFDNGEHEWGIVLVDIERFRIINEVYGNLVGDEVLMKVTDFLEQAIGDKGYHAYRYRNDQFVIVINASPDNEQSVFEEFISDVEKESRHFAETTEKDYEIKLYYGYTYCHGGEDYYIPDLISATEKQLAHKHF